MLTQKTPLKRKTPLKSYTSLKSKTPLKRTSIKRTNTKQIEDRNKPLERRVTVKKKKIKVKYQSIFTDDMHKCYITGDTLYVDPHHIFGGANKWLSEKYHFMLPLRRDWHETANYSIHMDREFDLKMKKACEDYYINILGLTKENWIEEFHKWW